MATAILADIHSNLAALEAVMRDIERYGVDKIYCLGDIIGYGPRPTECLDIAEANFDRSILGNHEEGVISKGFISKPHYFGNPVTYLLIKWTQEQILSDGNSEKYLKFLAGLERSFSEADILFVHGSPDDLTYGYLKPEIVESPEKLEKIFGLIQHVCFAGHTHRPGIIEQGNSVFKRPEELDTNETYKITGKKVVVNPGSVGQPRDQDPRASYVILYEDTCIFRRVDYDIERTANEIERIDLSKTMQECVKEFDRKDKGLSFDDLVLENVPPFLAFRLRNGQ